MIQAEGIFVGGGSDISAPIIGKDFNWSGGDGTYQVLEDGDGNWRIKFLSSGTFTPLRDMVIDAFLVGAGGGGTAWQVMSYYTGGGGGYTNTVYSIVLVANTEYQIVVGAGGAGTSNNTAGSGGTSSAFGSSATGGYGAETGAGGDGGSGGGGTSSGIGGTDGSNGTGSNPGTGQGTTTREFGESTGTLYASGGDGIEGTMAAASNTGDGGDAKKAGGSGIVIIRKHKEAAA